MNKLAVLIVLLGLGGAAGTYYLRAHRGATGDPGVKLRTAKVERGELVEGVQASATIQPVVLVQVGTQVSGVVEKLYKDFNDAVNEGEVIALIDSRKFLSQCAQDEASLGRARADVKRVRAQLLQAERDLERQRKLAARRLVAESDLDAAIASADALRAQLDVNAAVVSQTLAQLDGDLVNLRYCTISSPVSGKIVSRNVDVGQTVAAALSAPTIFVIAKDLTLVQAQASVPEAEIGKLHEGQRATFMVDAHPDHVFEGVVSQVRIASTTVQNVVTYTVLVDARNPRGLLLPGMTANVTFEVARSPKDSLTVPTIALRFTPSPELVEPTAPAAADVSAEAGAKPRDEDRGGPSGAKPRRGDREGASGANPDKKKRRREGGTVYVKLPSGLLREVKVRTGISDGVRECVTPKDEGALDEGTEVATGIQPEEEEAATNPFAPKMPGGGGRGGRGGH